MTEAKQTKKPKTAAELMKTPRHMLAWLRGQPARSIVTLDTLDNDACLAANFLAAHGHKFDVLVREHMPDWFVPVINDQLPTGTPITAQRAIAAIEKVV
jgi:hypothetical protein